MTQINEDVLFLNWFPYHGRSAGIAKALAIPCVFISEDKGNALTRYFRQWKRTAAFLRETSAKTIIVMQPPPVALWCVAWHTRKKGVRIAGDLHTGSFDDPKWSWSTRSTLRILRRRGIAIVTNEQLQEICTAHRCESLVLHDQIESIKVEQKGNTEEQRLQGVVDSDFVLVPLAYAHDEPVDEILRASEMTKDLKWVLTGRPPESIRERAGSNVVFSGFLDRSDFFILMERALAVLAITKNEDTMQRAGYEALSLGRPLVVSDTKVLREYYEGAAELTKPNAKSIADAVIRAVTDPNSSERMKDLREIRIAEQEKALEALSAWCSNEN